MAARMMGRVQKAFGVDMPLRRLSRGPHARGAG